VDFGFAVGFGFALVFLTDVGLAVGLAFVDFGAAVFFETALDVVVFLAVGAALDVVFFTVGAVFAVVFLTVGVALAVVFFTVGVAFAVVFFGEVVFFGFGFAVVFFGVAFAVVFFAVDFVFANAWVTNCGRKSGPSGGSTDGTGLTSGVISFSFAAPTSVLSALGTTAACAKKETPRTARTRRRWKDGMVQMYVL
jgi:hypothetical protein